MPRKTKFERVKHTPGVPLLAAAMMPATERKLEFVQLDKDTYAGYRAGAAVFWIHRSPVWQNQWHAFTWEPRTFVMGREYRNDLFEALQVQETKMNSAG